MWVEFDVEGHVPRRGDDHVATLGGTILQREACDGCSGERGARAGVVELLEFWCE